MNIEINLAQLSKHGLINRCKKLRIKGYSNKKKDEIIELIKETEKRIFELMKNNKMAELQFRNWMEEYYDKQFERRQWVEKYNKSLPQHTQYDEELQQEISVAFGGIYDIEYMEYVYRNNDLYGRIKNIRE